MEPTQPQPQLSINQAPFKRGYGHKLSTSIPSNIKTKEFTTNSITSFRTKLANTASKSAVKALTTKLTATKLNPKTYNLLDYVKLPSSQAPYDQGNLGSCTANAIAFCYVFNQLKQNNAYKFMPSRLFIYYNTRTIEGNINEDSGAYLYNVVQAIAKMGVCEEELCPYNIDKFALKPTDVCYKESKSCKALKVSLVQQNLLSL